MDKDLRDKWVAALRSGEYRQCRMILMNGNGDYCCMGVLAVLCGADLESESRANLGSSYHPSFQKHFQDGDATPALLADMNDHGKTFPVIADYIEAKL